MKYALPLLLALGACSGPAWLDFPAETGAQALPVPASVKVTFVPADLRTLVKSGKYAATILAGDNCIVVLPREDQVSAEDMQHIKVHELRHCAGQQHDMVMVASGRKIVVWK